MIKRYYTSEEIKDLNENRYMVNTDVKQSRYIQKVKPIILGLKEELITKEIASELNMSKKTVEGHIGRLIEVLGVKSRMGVVLTSIRMNIIDINEKPDYIESMKKIVSI